MLPDVGASELLVIAIVALLVVGPKDLPVLLRKLGQFMAKLRGMAAEFRSSFDEMARQSELDELRREVQALRQSQVAEMAALDDLQVQAMLTSPDDGMIGAEATPIPEPATAAAAKPAGRRKAARKAAAAEPAAVPRAKPPARRRRKPAAE